MKEFEVLNERLRDNADKANRYANLLMPVNANIGNLSYVLCAVAGGILALNGIGGITIGTIIAFVGLNKNFSQPITQISQQMNSVVMAAAGAGRVFELLDQKPEEDNGYVEFVNVQGTEGRHTGRDKRAHRCLSLGTPPIRQRGLLPIRENGRRHCF